MTPASPPPLLSVILPVYNAEGTVAATLGALLAQPLRPFEILVSDDGSTDGSLAVCRRCERENPGSVRVFTGPNAGVSVARNRALDAARGEWISFCDADDIPHPGIYARLLDLAREEEAELALCAFQWVNPGGRTDGPVVSFPYRGRIVLDGRRQIDRRFFHPLLRMEWHHRGNLVAGLFRREIIERARLRFVPRVVSGEDLLFMLEYLLRIRRLAAVDEILYDYVQHPRNASAEFKRDSEWRRAANEYRMARERLRIFRAWPRAVLHPLERVKFRLRVLDRARKCRAALLRAGAIGRKGGVG